MQCAFLVLLFIFYVHCLKIHLPQDWWYYLTWVIVLKLVVFYYRSRSLKTYHNFDTRTLYLREYFNTSQNICITENVFEIYISIISSYSPTYICLMSTILCEVIPTNIQRSWIWKIMMDMALHWHIYIYIYIYISGRCCHRSFSIMIFVLPPHTLSQYLRFTWSISYFDGSRQDCSNSIANALELL